MRKKEIAARRCRVIETLSALEDLIEYEHISLEQARAQLQLTDTQLQEIGQELEHMVASTKSLEKLTDEDCEALAGSVLKNMSKEAVLDLKKNVPNLLKTLDVGTQLLESQAVQKAPKPPCAPDPPALSINNKVVHGVGMAIAAGGPNARKRAKSWRVNAINGHPIFPCNQGRDEMAVYLEPTGYNAQELWAKVHGMDALTLDVFLAVLMLVCDPRNKAAYPHFGWFTVNPAQIVDMKAFRRYGNDRRILIGKVVESLHTISDLRTDFVIRWPGQGKNEQHRVARETGCRVLHIGSVVYAEQGQLFEHPEEFPKDKQALAVNIFIGKWGTYWLRDGERYYWVAAASRKLLEYEHRSDRMGEIFAKKIGMLLLTMEGGTNSQEKTLELTIETLLEEIRELLVEDFRGKRLVGDDGAETREGQNWATRTDDYLQQGLTYLHQDGLLASYNFGSDYPDPGDRGRGWVGRWLSTKVYLTTPKAAARMEQTPPQTQRPFPERKRRIRGQGKVRKPLQRGQYLDAATVAAVYHAYHARNWSQETLAKELKVARPTISNVLNGREAPSVELAARIRAFLDSPVGD